MYSLVSWSEIILVLIRHALRPNLGAYRDSEAIDNNTNNNEDDITPIHTCNPMPNQH